jgi:hypothetical protein
MGQRSQILVHVPNPVKHLHFETKAEKAKAISMFGTGKTTILSYHNNWCYGRGLVQQCLSLLEFAKNVKTYIAEYYSLFKHRQVISDDILKKFVDDFEQFYNSNMTEKDKYPFIAKPVDDGCSSAVKKIKTFK